ncbi:MAG: dCTP deaminase [Candidatus Methanoperedens sp.]
MEKKQLCCDQIYGVLPYQEIKRLIKNGNLIKEFDEKSIKESSYEIRVGSYFDFETKKPEPLSEGEVIGLKENCFALLGSMEHFNIPKDVTALMWLRSTYARDGWTPWFQGLVDPGYEGKVTIVLHNITSSTRAIWGGDRICHIRFNRMMEATEKPYVGKYMGSGGAQPPIKEEKRKAICIKKIIGEPIGSSDEIAKVLEAIDSGSKY